MIIIISYFSNVFSGLLVEDILDELEAEAEANDEDDEEDYDEKEEKGEKEKGGHTEIEEMGLEEMGLDEEVTDEFDDSFRDPDYQVAKNQVLSSSDDDLDLKLEEGFMSGEKRKRKAGPSGSQAGTRLEAGLGLGQAGGVVDAAEARGPGGSSPHADPLAVGAHICWSRSFKP